MSSMGIPDNGLDAILAAFERANDADPPVAYPDLLKRRQALIEAHPELADELRRYFVDVDALGGLLPPTSPGEFLGQPGDLIAGRYELQEKIGEGGMGGVWVAKQTKPVKRKVALKLIKAGMDSRTVLARFEQERQALAMMNHPNIARVLDAGLTPSGQPFFVMELVNGLPLSRFCDDARLTPKERLALFVPICQAVQHAHQKGIVHRDLKPANILITLIDGRPVPKVIDFGLAKALSGKLTDESLSTQFGAVVGTLEYMSPEQAGFSGVDIDTRSDIYSLGVVLYELLTGLRPIDAGRLKNAALIEMVRIIQEEEPSKPSTRLSSDDSLPSLAALRQTDPKKLMADLRGELDWIVMKCLEKQRDRRYETANALVRDIERYLTDEPVEARPPSASYRLSKFLRRNKGPTLAASLVLLTLVGGLVGTTFGLIRAEEQRRIAVRAQQSEADHAEGERRAKLEMKAEKSKAEHAAASEKLARQDAESTAKALRRALGKSYFDHALMEFNAERPHAGVRDLQRAWNLTDVNEPLSISIRQAAEVYRTRVGRPLRHEAGSVAAVAFSPNGKFIVTAGGMARLWNVDTCSARGESIPHDTIFAAAFSPDGHRLVTGSSDGTTRLWDVRSGRSIGKLMRHNDAVLTLALSRDSQRILTGSRDKTARLWDASTGTPLGSVLQHEDQVVSVGFSPDGQRVITGSHDKTARLWNARTGEPLGETMWHPDPVQFVAINSDGRRAVSQGQFATYLWDAHTGASISEPLQPAGDSVCCVAFSPDGKRVVMGGQSSLQQWDVHTGLPLGDPVHMPDRAESVVYSPDGEYILTGCYDHSARLWEARTGASVGRPFWHESAVSKVAFSPDGQCILTGSYDGIARLWSMPNRAPGKHMSRHEDAVLCLATSPDKRQLLTGSRDKTARLWDMVSGAPLGPSLRHDEAVACVAFSPDGTLLATASSDGTVRLWDAASTALIGEPIRHKQPVTSVAFTPDGRHLITSWGDSKSLLWDTRSGVSRGERSWIATNSAWTYYVDFLAFSPDGERLVTCCRNIGRASIWDARTSESLGAPLIQTRGFTCVAFSPDGQRVVTGGFDKAAQLWDAHSGVPLTDPLRHEGDVISVVFSPDGNRVLTATAEAARLWDAHTGAAMGEPIRPEHGVSTASFGHDGRSVLTGSFGGEVYLWHHTDDAADDLRIWFEYATGERVDRDGRSTKLTLDEWSDVSTTLGGHKTTSR